MIVSSVTQNNSIFLRHVFDNFFLKNRHFYKVSIHSAFLTQKSRGGRLAIRWDDGKAACQPIANHSRDFRATKNATDNRI